MLEYVKHVLYTFRMYSFLLYYLINRNMDLVKVLTLKQNKSIYVILRG